MSRYVIKSNEVVLDTKTGLEWKRKEEEGTYTYDEAMKLFAQPDAAGWRLPDIDELSSIIDRNMVRPSIDVTVFPGTPLDWHWSSSPYVGYSDCAWTVYFHHGGVYYDYRYNSFAVRLVRTGQ